jgi:hypothetical protein
MSTAYKPAFMYIHWRVHTHEDELVGGVHTMEKLLDWEWEQPMLGGYHILSRSSTHSIHLKTRRICNYEMGPGR